ncbi:SDR family oxidoreductase [Ketogulonicigenium vulgare]|uniref:SDR family oxidoreductase n=1 Tax=Ketogulonicigenium vulgare TaxID=92945 RepID=UPI0023584FC9|nr:SDR family oxidoreductase [Ketogulonicigenium vulgare]
MRALVTGAGARLGQAMALYLGRRGFDVAVHYATSKSGADDTVAALQAMGRRAAALQADLLVEDEVQGLIARAADALGGKLTCLVNNASVFEYDNIRTASRESWDRHIESNLRAPFVLTQGFALQAPKAIADIRGEPVAQALVVNMLDQRIHKLTPEFMSYTIAKMGLWALTRTAAQALAPDVRVNAIGPGPTLRGARQSEGHFARQRAATILSRGSNPDDICAALGYFLDAPSVTGQMLATDGGQHLGWQTPDILGVE